MLNVSISYSKKFRSKIKAQISIQMQGNTCLLKILISRKKYNKLCGNNFEKFMFYTYQSQVYSSGTYAMKGLEM